MAEITEHKATNQPLSAYAKFAQEMNGYECYFEGKRVFNFELFWYHGKRERDAKKIINNQTKFNCYEKKYSND